MIKNYKNFTKIWQYKANGKNFTNNWQDLRELKNGFYILIDGNGNYSFHSKGYALMLKESLKMEG